MFFANKENLRIIIVFQKPVCWVGSPKGCWRWKQYFKTLKHVESRNMWKRNGSCWKSIYVNCCFCASRKVLSLRNEKEVGALNHIEPKQQRVQAPLMLAGIDLDSRQSLRLQNSTDTFQRGAFKGKALGWWIDLPDSRPGDCFDIPTSLLNHRGIGVNCLSTCGGVLCPKKRPQPHDFGWFFDVFTMDALSVLLLSFAIS